MAQGKSYHANGDNDSYFFSEMFFREKLIASGSSL